MAKVSGHLGFTFRVGALDLNQYGRVDLNIDQIDTELPIEPQIEDLPTLFWPNRPVIPPRESKLISFPLP